MIMLPSSVADFANPEIAALIEKTQQSPAANSHDRVKFYKLAWDAVGSEFGSRHTQYEMFYAGATFVTKGHSFRTYDWGGADGLVQSHARLLRSSTAEPEGRLMPEQGDRNARQQEARRILHPRHEQRLGNSGRLSRREFSRRSCPAHSTRQNRRGTRTRLLRFEPGVYTTAPFSHEYWEEVYLVSGDLTVGNDENGEGGETLPAEHLCLPPAACAARTVQVRQRLPAARNPLFRPGLTANRHRPPLDQIGPLR